LMEHFTVADAYLVTILNWTRYSGIDLGEWPSVEAYYKQIVGRPAVAKALAEEFALYEEEEARRQANVS
jgi:glutathione S-transferase